ncbi:MAG: phosphoglycerate kinase [Nanoarchaeota archaeon]|nr:phosphoglycerate kinase [Nanoarchaeota archaeon]MBU1004780.1 phosphoglycerate kinase [Nanoarchaeota archaeon]MBU1945550.1 phosphoglycerate kinase [Nanoarchaeota archaeon]
MGEYPILDGLDVSGKRVLVRADYNVKVKDGKIKDDTRIRESLNTINYLTQHGAKVIIMAHLGRPQEELAEGKSIEDVKRSSTLAPVAAHLENLIRKEVSLVPDCIGSEVEKRVRTMQNGDVLMLENLRLHSEEEANDPKFAQSLANLCDMYVFDGFGVSHRAHASTAGVPLYMIEQGKPIAAGFLMDKELRLWSEARAREGYKLLVIGGAKLEEKTKAVDKLAPKVSSVLVGGAVYNIIRAGSGINIGDSLVTDGDENYVSRGKELATKSSNLILPERVVIARKSDYGDIKKIDIKQGVPEGYMIADMAIDDKIKTEIAKAQVIIWFGNIGMSDLDVNGSFPFAKGTSDFRDAISPNAYVIVGGGDSVTAAKGLANVHISTGGGASIQLYTKGKLDALEALKGNVAYFAKPKK